MLPSIFGENLFDDFFSDPFGMMVPQSRDPLYGKHGKNLMKTDVRETESSYELDMKTTLYDSTAGIRRDTTVYLIKTDQNIELTELA